MKRILTVMFLVMFFYFPLNAEYTPTEEVANKIDSTANKIEQIILEKGDRYRDNFLEAIDIYKQRYKTNQQYIGMLDALLLKITSKSTALPNILLIIADDMGLDATPGFSQGVLKPDMPILESLMNSGVTYNNLWSAPTCTPTRSTIMTGKYGYATDVLAVDDILSPSEIGIQKYLDLHTNQAYSHAVIGKWHLGKDLGHPESLGVGYYAGMQTGAAKNYYDWRFTQDTKTTKNTEYITTKFTNLAINWIEEQNNPWFLWLAYTAPHTPFHLPPSNLHSRGDLPDVPDVIVENPTPYYMAALEAMDTEIGRLLDTISKDELENTLIIFVGDNGTPGQVVQYPYTKKKAKGSLYEGGINVPMIVSGMGVTRKGEKDNRLVNTSDIYATIGEIAGIKKYSIHNSMSFFDSFTQVEGKKREYVYSEVEDKRNTGYTVRNLEHKLIVFTTGKRELYNLELDPYEQEDLLLDGINKYEEGILGVLEGYVLDAQK